MAADYRVFIDAPAGAERQRVTADAARAGWRVVTTRDEADAVLTPVVRRPVTPSAPSTPEADDDRPFEDLTPREREVLALLAEGAGNRDIASRLGVTEHTVKFHLSAIFGKLGAATRTEAVRRALKWGWVHI